VLEVKYLTDYVWFDCDNQRVNEHWSRYGSERARRCEEHLDSHLPEAMADLLATLLFESLCVADSERPDTTTIKEVLRIQRQLTQARLQMRGPGGSKGIVNSPEKIITLAKEYGSLQNDKTFGDRRDKALWEIICYRYDNRDPKWRQRAMVDADDIPKFVLDLVEKRRKFKLKPSHLALYHAASRAQIAFKFSSNSRTGKTFLKPSPSTLLRRCNEAATLENSRQKRKQKRTRISKKVEQSSGFTSQTV
jgi:hypothetical protein